MMNDDEFRKSLYARKMSWQGYRRVRKGKQYQISTGLISSTTFKQQDLLKEPPDCVFHLIFLGNNLLTNQLLPTIRPLFHRILNCLTPGGLLIIGAQEELPANAGPLKPCGPMAWKKVTTNE